MRLCLLVSRRCNLRCSFCHVDFTGLDMGWETAKAAVDRYLSTNGNERISRVKFFGGEPLLNWAVVRQTIEEGRGGWRDAGLRFELATNGYYLDSEKSEFLRRHPEVEVTLSFPAPKDAFLPGFWYTMVLDHGCRPEKVVADLRLLLRRGYRRFNFLPAYFVSWTDAEIVELRKSLRTAAEIIKRLWADGIAIRVKNLDLLSMVPLFNDATTIDADGCVYASNFIQIKNTEQARKELYLGHILRDAAFRPRPGRNILVELLKEWAGPEAWNSTQRVDAELTHFVHALEPATETPVRQPALT